MSSSDSYLVNVLDKLEETGLLDNTLVVRTADHGEMGLAHGGLRQKNFNFYEEAIAGAARLLEPEALPEAGADRRARLPRRLPADAGEPVRPRRRAPAPTGRGSTTRSWSCARRRTAPRRTTSSSPTTTTSRARPAVRTRKPPNHIVSIREGRWKLAKYYDVEGRRKRPQWEMYDLKTDPLETTQPRLLGLQTHAPRGRGVQTPQAQARPGRKDPPAAVVATRQRTSRGSDAAL